MTHDPTRIYCCIPGCRRSASRRAARFEDAEEIICGKHWRMIDTPIRARQRTVARRWRKAERLLTRKAIAARVDFDRFELLTMMFVRSAARSWAACKLDATIKAAMHAEDAPRRRVAA